MTVSRAAIALIMAQACAAAGWAQQRDIKVSVDGGKFEPGTEIPVSVALMPAGAKPGRLPQGASNPRAFYFACTAKNEADTWKTGLGAEVFCDLADAQTKLFSGHEEPVGDIVNGTSRHTFSEKLLLPKQPVGTKLWAIVRLDYDAPGLAPGIHGSLYGSVHLLYRCEGGKGVTDKVTCRYYTPGGWAIQRGATH